jgi:prevent-host-death family protein
MVFFSSQRLNIVEEIAISEFKAKCLALLERVRKTKQPIRITRFGRPVAEVVPPSPVAESGAWLGSLADTTEILGDIVSPVIEETDWEALRD